MPPENFFAQYVDKPSAAPVIGQVNPRLANAEARANAAEARAAEDQRRQNDKDAHDRAHENDPKLKPGYRWKDGKVGGAAELIPGVADSDSKPTEFQSKSAGFLGRMLHAESQFNAVPEGSRDPRTWVGQQFHNMAPELEGSFNNPDRQVADSSALDFVRAALRQESGASINADEERKQYRIYFPMPGDSAEVLQAKAAARQQAIAGFRLAAGPEAAKVDATLIPSNAIAPQRQPDQAALPGTKPLPAGGGLPPSGSNGPQRDGSNMFAFGPGGVNPGVGGDTGSGGYFTKPDPAMSNTLDKLIRQGMSADQINAVITQNGADPVSQEQVTAAQRYLQGNPTYKGSLGSATRSVPRTWGQFAAQSLPATVFNGAVRGATANLSMLPAAALSTALNGGSFQGNMIANEDKYQAANNTNGGAGTLGEVAGGIGGMVMGGQALRASRLAPWMAANPVKAALGADLAYGTASGAAGTPDDPLKGAAIGSAAALGGNVLGRYAIAPVASAVSRSRPVQAAGDVFAQFRGQTPPVRPQPLNQAERMIAEATQGQGPQIMGDLTEAARLNVPMTLADANPSLRALAGAASRRSPNAKALAESALIPRGRGQIDRLNAALDRYTVPATNIPQTSEALIRQARTDAKPLYDQFRAAPGASSVDTSGFAKTPMGQAALDKANLRISNRLGPDGQPIDPTSLGFDFGPDGNMVLGKTPSFEALDHVKRGLDDVIDGGFDPMKGRYSPEAQAAQGLKTRLVSQIDAVNPFYADARAAYAGPAGEREALQMGTRATNINPDIMAQQMGNMPAPRQQQYRLGFRSALGDQAEKVRYAGNPWEAVYGSPVQQERIGQLFPQGAPSLNRQYGLEQNLARTQNEVLGNSLTAERQGADQAFGMGPGMNAALEAGQAVATGGASLPLSLLRAGASYGKDRLKLGVSQRRADMLAPLLFNPNTAASAAAFADVGQRSLLLEEARRQALEAARRRLGPAATIGAIAATQ